MIIRGQIMKISSSIAAAILLSSAVISVPATASSMDELHTFIGASYGLGDANEKSSSLTNEPNPDLMIARAGVYLTDYLSVEVRAGFNPSFHDTGKVEIRNLSAFYIKPEIPVSDNVSFNAVLGYGAAIYTNENGDSSKGDSLSFGVGGKFYLDQATALTVDFARTQHENSLTIDSYVIGVSYDFVM